MAHNYTCKETLEPSHLRLKILNLEPAVHVRTSDTITPAERSRFKSIIGRLQDPEAIVDTDMTLEGQYAEAHLVLADQTLFLVENDEVKLHCRLDDVVSIESVNRVGNGTVEVRSRDDQTLTLVRYSHTSSDAISEMVSLVRSQSLGTTAETAASETDGSVSSSGRSDPKTFRCPNCSHPLDNPNERCPKCADSRKSMLRLLKFLLRYKMHTILGTLLGFVIVLINLAPAALVRQLIDNVLERPDLPVEDRHQRLFWLVGIFFVLVGVRLVAQHWRIRIMGVLAANVIRDLRSLIFRALQRLSLSYYDRSHTGRIMARVLNDTQGVQNFVVGGIQTLVLHGMMVLFIPVLLIIESPKLAAVALFPIPVVVIMSRYFSRRYKSLFRAMRRRFATLSALVSESISGMRVIRSFAQEDREITGFETRNNDVYDAQLSATRVRATFTPAVLFMVTMGTIVVWLYGGRMVIAGEMTLGVLIQFIAYMNMFYNPVQMLIDLTESFQNTSTAAERVFSIIDMPSEVGDHEDARDVGEIRGKLVFENVAFEYSNGERVLSDINLTIQPGEMIGLVGKTGSGKSTLVSLVCRFYDPTEGRVMLDEVDLADIKQRSLRARIGMVLQETVLFAGTVRDNIAYGRPDAGVDEIVEAAKVANAHEFIMSMPDGYDTEVGERGSGLSGGEKQRISIARAVLKDPAILILDEATSAVDTATEQSIQGAMDRLVAGRTTIAIAHRLSTLRNADRILVMDDGAVIESGTHDALLAEGGVYAGLVDAQGLLDGSSSTTRTTPGVAA